MSVVHHTLDRVIFYGLLVTIVLTAIPYGTVQPWWIALFECMIFLLGLLGLLDLLITKERLPTGVSLAVPAAVLCLFLLFQALPLFTSPNSVIPNVRLSVSADRFSTWLVAVKLFALIIASVLMWRYARTEARWRTLIYVVIAVGVASALLGIMRHGNQSGSGWFFPLPNDARGFGQFVNRNHFGFLMEMVLGLTLGLLIRGSHGYRRFAVLLPIAIFLWVALILSNSRGGIFASLCQVIFLVIMINPLSRRQQSPASPPNRFGNVISGVAVRAVLIVGLVVLFVYGVSWVGGEGVVSNLELTSNSFSQQGGHEHRENVSRKDVWAATWQLIKAHPIVGSGFGAYWIAITKYHNASGKFTPQEAHNDYLELLASGGVIGTALVAWFAVRFVKSARRTLRSANPWMRAAALGALTGIFGVMVHSFLDFGLHVTANALIFTSLIAIAGRDGLKSSVHDQEVSLAHKSEFEAFAEPDFATH